MSGARKTSESRLMIVAVVVGIPIAALVAFLAYVSSVDPIHADPNAVPSAMPTPPLPKSGDILYRGTVVYAVTADSRQ